uniref:ABC transporter domain-containing protein n=1 Tax=Zea mays TaxID=4577 RepID=A0A804PHQ4_MAIZE
MGANCLAQTNALFRKNLVIQRRNHRSNCCLICFPLVVCLLLGGVQLIVAIAYASSAAHRPRVDCGGCTASTTSSSSADTVVGGPVCPTQCPLPTAPKWPPVLQLPPAPEDMEEIGSSTSTDDLTGASTARPNPPAATFLVTGTNRSFAEGVMSNMFSKHDELSSAANISAVADFALGTNEMRFISNGAEELGSDFDRRNHLFFLQTSCTPNATLSFPVQQGRSNFTKDAGCIEGLFLWREDSSAINSESYRGYYKEDKQANQIASAYDLTSSDLSKFNLIVSYNSTYKGAIELSLSVASFSFSPILLRVPRLLNLVSNAYLQLRGSDTKMQFEFIKDMPRVAQQEFPIDISFLVGKLVFVWMIMLYFPVILSNLVYEKEQKLRTIMKMHGLGDMAYWIISYCYFLLLSLLYMLFLVSFGSIFGIKLFRLSDYRVQFVVYFAYINLQVSFAFLMATFFSNCRTASVTGYLFTIGSAYSGEYLFRPIFEDMSLSNFSGVHWEDLSDHKNGMLDILIIMAVEWATFLLLTFFVDEFGTFRNGIRKTVSIFRSNTDQSSHTCQMQTIQLEEFLPSVETDRTDVSRERETVQQLLRESDSNFSVICDNLKKVYHGKDGNAEKIAVAGLSLSVQRGQCFGILGPNGAGKTSLISMAVEHSLRSVRLFDGGIADKRVAKYSGGMKRRLSVAISLIGDPKVVYMDEPSSGLDPASRRALWNAVMSAKENRAIVLTTHSMEEAEALCDRIGIMVNGSLQCIGNSKELKARYGGTYMLTVTAAAGEEAAVEQLVRSLCPAANGVYRISGTQKFEMPKQGLRISEVFQAMERAKSWLNIAAWGLSDATLEDTFIKVASGSDASSV